MRSERVIGLTVLPFARTWVAKKGVAKKVSMNLRIVIVGSAVLFVGLSAALYLALRSQTPSKFAMPEAPSVPVSGAAPLADSAGQASAGATGVKTYTVRGRIITLPARESKIYFQVHHEEIKDFLDKDGKVVGMKEMIMPFPDLAPNLSLAAFSTGDVVAITFDVRWDGPPRTLVTSVTSLSAPTPPLLLSNEVK